MKNGKLGVCLIGAGRAGMIHAENFSRRIPGAVLSAIADPSQEALQAAGREWNVEKLYTDYREALADKETDAVVIVTPTKYHCEIAVAAARAGKHILCEKPMAMTMEECECMEEVASQCHVKLQIGFMRRFDPSFQEAKRLVETGEIGDVVMVKSNTRGPSRPKPWMYDIRKSNGPLAEVNSHDIDTLRWFTGSEYASVYAIAGNYRCPEAALEFPDFYDNVALVAGFANGMQGMIDGAQGVSYGYDARVEILGTRGCIFLGKTREKGISICTGDGKRREDFVGSWRFLFKDAYLEEDMAFVKCIQEDSAPLVTGRDGKIAVNIVNVGNLSIAKREVIIL